MGGHGQRPDFITIVPAEGAGDEIGNHQRAGRGSPGRTDPRRDAGALRACAYVLDQGRRPLARALVEVNRSEVTLEVPETVPAGARVRGGWEGRVNGTGTSSRIVPAEAPDDEIGKPPAGRPQQPGQLTARGRRRLYELRYVLDQGRRPLARALVEVTEPSPTLGNRRGRPRRAERSSSRSAAWSNPRDFSSTLVEPGTSRKTRSGAMSAPGEGPAGKIENSPRTGRAGALRGALRSLDQGRRMLAYGAGRGGRRLRRALRARARWSRDRASRLPGRGRTGANDRIVLVPADAPDGAEPLAEAPDPEAPVDPRVRLDAPAEPGTYELALRPGDNRRGDRPGRAGSRAAGSQPEVGRARGGPAGGTIQVAWTGPGNERDRVTLAEVGASDTTWASAARVSDGNPGDTGGAGTAPGPTNCATWTSPTGRSWCASRWWSSDRRRRVGGRRPSGRALVAGHSKGGRSG